MWRQAAIAAAGLALAAGACDASDDPPAPVARSPAPSAVSADPPAAPRARPVRFRASDGKRVEGAFRPAGAAAPAVVLVNGLVGGVEQWGAFVPYLHDAGFAALAFDGRGGVDETELIKEVAGAVAFLRRRGDVDARRLAIVGSSVGASTAVLATTGREGRRLCAAVALSPPAAPAFDALRKRNRYHPRNVLFVSDHRERATVAPLTRGAVGSRLAVSEMVGHGVALLEDATNRQAVLDWLERHVS
jgi:hypothetical protein